MAPDKTRPLDNEAPARPDAGPSYRLPRWVLGWFYTTAVVCTWDASFIFLRPHTLPGGKLFPFWRPYSMYITIDQRYKDQSDPFVFGISLFNYFEVVLNIIAIVMHYKNSPHTAPLAFTVSVMTFWKTLFYFYAFSELGGGGPFRVGNTFWEELLLVVIPNGIWILLPFMVMAALWSQMIPARNVTSASAAWQQQGPAGEGTSVNNLSPPVKGSLRDYLQHAKHA